MIEIRITVPDTLPSTSADTYIRDCMKSLGYIKGAEAAATWKTIVQYVATPKEEQQVKENLETALEIAEREVAARKAAVEQNDEPLTDEEARIAADVLIEPEKRKMTAMDGDRERGKAGPGHRRRTDKQIAEDTAYFASLPASAPLAPGADAPLISTGEERISPEDAADEAAETAARATDKPTLETLRAAVGRYTEAFGAKASIENIRAIIGKPMIEVAEDDLPAAIARVEAAIKGEFKAPGNPTPAASAAEINSVSPATATAGQAAQSESIFGNEPADKPTEPVHATKTDVVEAFTAYGKKYDGTDDPKLMTMTQQDLPKVLEQTFGAGIKALSKIPQTPESFGKAMTAVYVAVRDNPFKRAVKS